MIFVANAWISIGILGFVASTFGTALLARLIAHYSTDKRSVINAHQAFSLDVLVAAHNEEALIAQTLSSIADASDRFSEVRIRVGADHCTDQTEARALEWSRQYSVDFKIIYNPGPAGKWNMLQALVRSSQAEWLALVDVGSVWDRKLLRSAMFALKDSGVMAIAPSYRAVAGGFLENLSWKLERSVKILESSAGGPVTVHGASVFYRRELLLKALDQLAGRSWLNDDVVIPLTLRTLYPKLRIVYLSKAHGDAWVKDFGIKQLRNIEYARRKRILIGNLEWMRSLLGKAIRSDVKVGIIASRRVFRAFWAYWALFIFMGAALRVSLALHSPIFGMAFAFFLIITGVTIPLKGSLERLRAAFFAGLELPLHWININETTSEKIWN